MVGEVTKTAKKAVNRLVVGLLFLIIFGLIGGLSIYLLGVPLTGDLQDLASGIENLNSLEGFGQIIWWVVSVLVIAFVAIFLVARQGFLIPFKSVEAKPDIPKRTFLITAIILGAIIVFLFWLTNQVLRIFGTDLSATDVVVIFNALVSGDFTTLFVGLLFAIIVGTIVVFVANRTGSIQKAEGDLGLPKV